MKIDRLLAITIYLLNREKVTAKVLAEKFEVSQRTIQRDIDTLTLAGIPISSTYGAQGGYEILNTFKMNCQIGQTADYSLILSALSSLSTGISNVQLSQTLEKVQSLVSEQPNQLSLSVNLSAAKERDWVNDWLSLLQEAIVNQKPVSFVYTNTQSYHSEKCVEPIHLIYKWHAWYLIGYCKQAQTYRQYKLVRMQNLQLRNSVFLKVHASVDEILHRLEAVDTQTYLDIQLYCKAAVRVSVLEYLNGKVLKTYDNGDFEITLRLPENERYWFGILLSFGDQVTVLAPDRLKKKLCLTSEKILAQYAE